MSEERIELEDAEMQELAGLVAEALGNGDSREAIVDDLIQNGLPVEEAEQLVDFVEHSQSQVSHAQPSGGGEGMGWLIWIGIIIGINVLSHIFNWGFVIY